MGGVDTPLEVRIDGSGYPKISPEAFLYFTQLILLGGENGGY